MPDAKVIVIPKINNKTPLIFAEKTVLKPVNKKTASIISIRVTIKPIPLIINLGAQGFSSVVYSRKLLQVPQADFSVGHRPNLSATAEINPAAMLTRKKSLMYVIFIGK